MEELNYKYWTEATEGMIEYLFSKHDVKLINNYYAKELLKIESKIVLDTDGFHYKRKNRYGEMEKYCIYGYDDSKIFDQIIFEIDETLNFEIKECEGVLFFGDKFNEDKELCNHSLFIDLIDNEMEENKIKSIPRDIYNKIKYIKDVFEKEKEIGYYVYDKIKRLLKMEIIKKNELKIKK